jgi:hypothetical protein
MKNIVHTGRQKLHVLTSCGTFKVDLIEIESRLVTVFGEDRKFKEVIKF